MKRKTEITVESYEVVVISRYGSLKRGWCASCGKQVAIVSLNEAFSPTAAEVNPLDGDSTRVVTDPLQLTDSNVKRRQP